MALFVTAKRKSQKNPKEKEKQVPALLLLNLRNLALASLYF